MSYMTAETDDEILSREYSGSPSTDEGNGSGTGLKKGPWTSAEDAILMDYVHKHGEGNWNVVQKYSGLSRCGKSCRLRWANHLRPNLKKGAFTPEEERLIIELHAKMGNKWARMAAQLPGRTDNEIKNYWNTRMKRRQRAGLPLYPLDFCFQQMQESQVNQNDSVDGRQNDNLQPNHYEISDITFNHLKDTRGVSPYIPEIPCISPSSMLLNTLNPSGYYGFIPPIVHRPKRPREAAPSFFEYSKQQPMDDNCGDLNSRSFGSFFSYDPDPMNRYILPSGENQGFCSHKNVKFSAFELSSRASSKLELSSFQNPETDFTSWEFSSPPALCDSVDAFIQSPPHSPKNSGLLDALLHEAKIKSSSNLQLSQKSLNFNALIPDDKTNYSGLDISEKIWTEYGDSMSPLGNSSASIFSDCTPLSVNGSPLDENSPAETLPGNNINSEAGEQVWRMDPKKKENEAKLDYSRPDALLGSCWFGQGFAHQKDQVPKKDYISASAHNDLAYDDKLIPVTTSPDQGWELSSYPWNSMPAVCHISELP